MNKNLLKNMKKKKKGFTLIELIIVIAIIAILAAMAIPKFGAVRLDSQISNDIAAAKNIQSATAVLVANGTLTTPQTNLDPNDNADIKARIDGSILPKAGTASGTKFSVNIDSNGNVTVMSKGVQLAPAQDDTSSKYKTAVTTTTTP